MIRIVISLMIASQVLFAIDNSTQNAFIGSAYTESISYRFLGDLCRKAGGRLAGSPSAKLSKQMILAELNRMNITSQLNSYPKPGWERGRDYLRLIQPFDKEIRAYTLGYSQPMPKTTANLVVVRDGNSSDYEGINAVGNFVLIIPDGNSGKPALSRNELINIAAEHGACAVLFPGAKDGGMVLVSVANFEGKPTPIPAFCITKEDGLLLRSQIESGLTPKVEAEVNSKCKEIEIANIRAIFPGKSAKKVLLLAHYDSWDISTGAVDNGVGSAVLMDIARLIKSYSPDNYFTIECVWTDAEEIGLYGAKELAERVSDSVAAVINMDMPGSPTGIDIMGFEKLRKISEEFLAALPGYKFDKGVRNEPWINSDHAPLMIKGVPAVTFYGFDDSAVYKHYHDFGDTFDKVNPKYMSDAAAIIGLYALTLANYPEVETFRMNRNEIIELLKQYKLDDKLKRQGEWIYD